jgi:alkyl sulfatase BDS1-like metallo-beta-lactamase superfamily hydrolase
VTWPRASIVGVLFGESTLDREVAAGRVNIDGDQEKVNDLIGLLDQFNPLFNIISPNAAPGKAAQP